MVNFLELIKGLHYIIGPAGELITAVGITLHHWPVRGITSRRFPVEKPIQGIHPSFFRPVVAAAGVFFQPKNTFWRPEADFLEAGGRLIPYPHPTPHIIN